MMMISFTELPWEWLVGSVATKQPKHFTLDIFHDDDGNDDDNEER